MTTLKQASNPAPPISNELQPTNPVVWEIPPGGTQYRVIDGDTWASVAVRHGFPNGEFLIAYNFHVDVGTPRGTDIVNWYLRNYVGCNVTRDGGRNWAFSNSADPGYIIVPLGPERVVAPVPTPQVEAILISVPEYNDDNVLDELSQELDKLGAASMAFEVFTYGVTLPAALEVGMIATGAVTSATGPLIAIGASYTDVLKAHARYHFFEGFSYGFLMTANYASVDYISQRHELRNTPFVSHFQEKAESYRKLRNYGIKFGIKKARGLSVGQRTLLFTWIRQQTSDPDYFGPSIPFRDWSEAKIKKYYYEGALAVRTRMLRDNLQFRLRPQDVN